MRPLALDRLCRLRPAARRADGNRWRVVGSAAGVVMAAASWFCAATPHEFPSVWPGFALWRPDGGSPLAASAVFLAMAVMLYAWWAVRDLRLTVAWHRWTAVAWFGPLLFSASLFSRDIYSYAAQGLMLQHHLDPYTEGVQALSSPWAESVSSVWLDTPAPYGPVFMVLARGAAVLAGGHQLVALLLLRLLAAGGVAVMLWAVPCIARQLDVDPARATWLGTLTPLVGSDLVSGAHNDALMIAGILASLALALGRRYLWAVLAIAVATTVKVPAVVVVPFLALLWAVDPAGAGSPPWRAVIRRSVLMSAATLLGTAILSVATGLGLAWVAALSTPGKSVQWTSPATALGMAAGGVGQLVGADIQDRAVALFRTLALALLVVVLVGTWLHAVKHSRHRRLVCRSAGVAVLAVVVLAPAFHGWYLLWALPVLAATTRRRREVTVLAAVASVLAVAVLPGGYSLALTTTWVGVPLMVLATGYLLYRAWRAARAYPWGELLSVAGPWPDAQPDAQPGDGPAVTGTRPDRHQA